MDIPASDRRLMLLALSTAIETETRILDRQHDARFIPPSRGDIEERKKTVNAYRKLRERLSSRP